MTPALGRWRQQQLPCIRPAPGRALPQPRALLRDDIYLPAGNAREMILLESITSKGRRKCCITFRWELGQVVFPSIHIRPFTQHCTDFPEPLSRVWLCAGSGDGDKRNNVSPSIPQKLRLVERKSRQTLPWHRHKGGNGNRILEP